ncbi:MAG TPA: ComEC/Rec2 family competence protein, partial [Allocoleopsis sp.]
LPAKGRWRWLQSTFILSILWVFSFIAGGQPSILRATVMFTFILVGKAIGRKNSIFNSIAGSAFLLLCIDPFSIFDAGFQLSYAAVLSIILFYKPIYHAISFQNKLVNNGWKLVSVTLAAQLLTFPVSLYHFHQFPVYFLLSNLVAVPLSGIILIGEIITCLLSFVPLISKPIGSITSQLITWMNVAVEWVGQLPGNRIGGIMISFLQTVLLLGFIILMMHWLQWKVTVSLLTSMCLFVLFLIAGISSRSIPNEKNRIIVYSIPRHSAIDLISARKAVSIQDSLILRDPSLTARNIDPSRMMFGVTEESQVLIQGNSCFDFCGRRILVLGEPLQFQSSSVKDKLDLLILSNRADPDITNYQRSFS